MKATTDIEQGPTGSSQVSLAKYLEQQRARIDAELERLLPPEAEPPATIHRAMRYSVFAGGKRIRPIFCLAAAEAVAGGAEAADGVPNIEAIASTLELIHTYSLIHDDLPALDNDDYRRGKPTCHKAFGEAMAILAGDALLTLAFQVLANLRNTPPDVAVALVSELARAAGTVDGMIGGQVADIEALQESVDSAGLEYIHRSKTAAMFRASVCLGGIAARASAQQLAALASFGQRAGLAFQIVDDILDVESSTEVLGKTAGKDAAQHKATYPAVHGLERSREMAAHWISEAKAALQPFRERANRLRELGDFLVFRKA